MHRRLVLQRLGLAAAGVCGARAWPATAAGGSRVFPATAVNHLAYGVADYARTRDFYVDLLGMRVAWDNGKQCALEFGDAAAPNGMYIRTLGAGEKPNVNHIAFSVADFAAHKDAVKAELERRGLRYRADGEFGWIAYDPEGFMLNICAEKGLFPGAAAPCEVLASPQCKDAEAAGLRNLSAAPKPSGRGFRAYAYRNIALRVADIGTEREFYRDVFGMTVTSGDAAGSRECVLRFGRNTLALRQGTGAPAPVLERFGFVVERFDEVVVKAELDRRRLAPTRGAEAAWTIADPDGMRIEIAG